MKNLRALSIRQPYAEQIMRGTKPIEERSRSTNIRERVYIYASLQPGNPDAWRQIKKKPGDLPIGVLIGTVQIVDCTGEPGNYGWHWAKPKRLAKPLKPMKHPQPAWFYPF